MAKVPKGGLKKSPTKSSASVGSELSAKDARKAVRWFQKSLGIADWEIKLSISDDPPGWALGDADDNTMGLCAVSPTYKSAKIWVSEGRAIKNDTTALKTLYHECLHVVAADTGIEEGQSTSGQEFTWNMLGNLLADYYEKIESKIKRK